MKFISKTWTQIFVGGVVLFAATEQAFKYTDNIKLLPAVILLGAFVVPAAFVAFFYSRERAVDRRTHGGNLLPLAFACFLGGGFLGVTIAGFVEYETLRHLSPLALFGVGLIEESAKLLFPIAIYIRGNLRSEADGLLFGVASGMGFAALETMGYGLTAFVKSHGNLGTVEEVLLVRSLISPIGHAAWTGFVCAVLWRERERTGRAFNPIVIVAFAIAVALHATWDIIGTSSHVYLIHLGYIFIGGISLLLLVRRIQEIDKVQGANASKLF